MERTPGGKIKAARGGTGCHGGVNRGGDRYVNSFMLLILV